MTLKEFVENVLMENNIQSDVNEIISKITDIARERAVDNMCAISDEEVRQMVINNADLVNQLEKEKQAKKEAELEKKKEEQRQKLIEEEKKNNANQVSLFEI